MSAPVLAHPEQGNPYRLYTDTSDEAIGCTLQQVQEIHVWDLEGMKVYQRIRLEYEAGRPPPRLTSQVASRFPKAEPKTTSWGPRKALRNDTLQQNMKC